MSLAKIETVTNPIVGRYYFVRCVLRTFNRHRNIQRWWPVIGPYHDDEQDLNFGWMHFHTDWRFVNPACRFGL